MINLKCVRAYEITTLFFIGRGPGKQIFPKPVFHIIDGFVQVVLLFHVIKQVGLDGVVGEFAQPYAQCRTGSPLRYSLSNSSFTTGMISSSAQV